VLEKLTHDDERIHRFTLGELAEHAGERERRHAVFGSGCARGATAGIAVASSSRRGPVRDGPVLERRATVSRQPSSTVPPRCGAHLDTPPAALPRAVPSRRRTDSATWCTRGSPGSWASPIGISVSSLLRSSSALDGWSVSGCITIVRTHHGMLNHTVDGAGTSLEVGTQRRPVASKNRL